MSARNITKAALFHSIIASLGLAALSASAAAQESEASSVISSPDANAVTLAEPWTILAHTPPPIRNFVIVDAPVERAWELWTDGKVMTEFMGFEAEIDPRPGGVFRVEFVPDAATPIERGNDGRIVAIDPLRMLSVTWMTPMHMKELSGNSTSLVLYFTSIDGGKRTQVDLINTGYGMSGLWRDAYAYNVNGWDRVLAHFQYATDVGPIDWKERAKDLSRDKTLPMWRSHQRAVAKGVNPWPNRPDTSE